MKALFLMLLFPLSFIYSQIIGSSCATNPCPNDSFENLCRMKSGFPCNKAVRKFFVRWNQLQ